MFDLFVTTATGMTFRTLASPYESRHDAALTTLVLIGDPGLVGVDFAERVRTAELGTEVTHEGSGISFRTEESPATTKEN